MSTTVTQGIERAVDIEHSDLLAVQIDHATIPRCELTDRAHFNPDLSLFIRLHRFSYGQTTKRVKRLD